MYKRAKNKLSFVIFITIILLILTILIIAVYNTKGNDIEEYKISLNSIVYDENYNYIPLEKEAVLKKEWDKKYYLYIKNSSDEYSLGKETVFYDKSKNQVTIYGNIYQVYPNGDINQKKDKTVISGLKDFQFFKLKDRKYLIIGDKITSDNFSTANYLIVSIDKAGKALLLNNELNVKTVNPMILNVGNVKFDIANEKLNDIDLKKINGSTNEYTEKEEEPIKDNNASNNNQTGNETQSNNNTVNNKTQVYNNIVNQIINLSGLLSNTMSKTNLYKNIGLRGINPGASYLNISYSIIDPQNRYASVFLILNGNKYYLNKDTNNYRIMGLTPNTQYSLSINYILSGSTEPIIADSVEVLTSIDPTSVRITTIYDNKYTYNVKMFNEYEFSSATVQLTDCLGNILVSKSLNISTALTAMGDIGILELESNPSSDFVCLILGNVFDKDENNIDVNSYHKIKIN